MQPELNLLYVLLPVLSIALTLVVAVGGVFAFRGNAHKSALDAQKSTIESLMAQNQAQEKQIQALERKIERLEATFTTVQYTLKKRRGLLVEINDDVVTLIDQRTGQEHTVKIHTEHLTQEETA